MMVEHKERNRWDMKGRGWRTVEVVGKFFEVRLRMVWAWHLNKARLFLIDLIVVGWGKSRFILFNVRKRVYVPWWWLDCPWRRWYSNNRSMCQLIHYIMISELIQSLISLPSTRKLCLLDTV